MKKHTCFWAVILSDWVWDIFDNNNNNDEVEDEVDDESIVSIDVFGGSLDVVVFVDVGVKLLIFVEDVIVDDVKEMVLVVVVFVVIELIGVDVAAYLLLLLLTMWPCICLVHHTNKAICIHQNNFHLVRKANKPN